MADWLVVGLGNPDKKYQNNRHNVGWMAVIELCKKHKSDFNKESKKYWQSIIRIKDQKVILILPTTYMNASGEAVVHAKEKFGIENSNILVVVDEYNFPVGKIHIKNGGSDGGHNGISSVIEELDDDAFFRLRCGIGKDFPPGMMVDYVLSDFKKKEQEALGDMLIKIGEAIEHIVINNPARALSDINSGRLWKKEETEEEKKTQKPEITISAEQ